MLEIEPNSKQNGVSIITCTNKPAFLENVFNNYTNQGWPEKELTIILNNDSMDLDHWRKKAEENDRVKVYQLPESMSLGKCLNFAVENARYDFIAKFDDDDYYAPQYLFEAMHTFEQTNADVVGKRSYYMYMTDSQLLFIRFPSREHRWARLIHGGTIVARKEVLKILPFADMSLGEDVDFLRRCRKKGFRIYSTSHFYYTYLRRDEEYHTWKADKRYLFRTSKKVTVTPHFQDYANCGPYEKEGADIFRDGDESE